MDAETEFVTAVRDFARRGHLAVFVGAGVSLEAGGLLVLDFLDDLLKNLKIVEADSSRVLTTLPFEAVLQELAAEVDIRPLLALFELREPTTFHIFLAKLARKGLVHTIATTNFDQLIEFALDNEGLERRGGYAVFHDDHSFSEIEFRSRITKVIKLHGSIEDPRSVVITLKRVASRVMLAQRQAAIDYVFRTGSHSAVLVVGYSCSDVFDITPQIISNAGKREKKTILFIEHHGDADGMESSIEPVSQKDYKNPFKEYEGIRIRTDTGRIMRLLWSSLFEDVMPTPIHHPSRWRNILADYLTASQASEEPMCSLIAGRILLAIGELNAAESRFRRALQVANRLGDARLASCAAANAAGCCVYLGDYEHAAALYKAGMKLALAAGDRGGYIGNRIQLANVYHSYGRYAEALQLLYQAFDDVQDLGDQNLAIVCTGNIAAVLHDQGNLEQALEYSSRQLVLARTHGDKTSQIFALDRLGLIHRNMGKLVDAVKCHSEGLEISRLVGDRVMQSKHLGELGVCSHLQGRYTEAAEQNLKALRLARETGDRRAEGNRLANLGRHYRAAGRFNAAYDALQAAVKIAREIGDQQGESNAVGSLGLLYEDMKKPDDAYHCQEEALRITRQIGDRIGTIAHLRNLAHMSIKRGDMNLAKRFLLEAAEVCEGVYGTSDSRTHETTQLLALLTEAGV